jgi:hypothetical protein
MVVFSGKKCATKKTGFAAPKEVAPHLRAYIFCQQPVKFVQHRAFVAAFGRGKRVHRPADGVYHNGLKGFVVQARGPIALLKRTPADHASGLRSGAAGRAFFEIGGGHWQANQVGSHHLPLQRLPIDKVAHQPPRVQGTLAVAGDHKAFAAVVVAEVVQKSGAHIGVGGIKNGLAHRARKAKGLNMGLPVAGSVHVETIKGRL